MEEALPKPLALWDRIDGFVARVEGYFLIVALLVMILMAFSQVIMRNFFSGGVLWFDPVVRHLVLWIGFMGAAVATREKHHINIDALSKFFTGKKLYVVNMIVDSFATFVCVVLFFASYAFVKDTFQAGDQIHSVFPSWVAQMVLPYAFAIMASRFFRDGIVSLWRLVKNLPPPVKHAEGKGA